MPTQLKNKPVKKQNPPSKYLDREPKLGDYVEAAYDCDRTGIIIEDDGGTTPFFVLYGGNNATDWEKAHELKVLSKPPKLPFGPVVVISDQYVAYFQDKSLMVGCQEIDQDAVLKLANLIRLRRREAAAKKKAKTSKAKA